MKILSFVLAFALIMSELSFILNQNLGFAFYIAMISGTLIALAYADKLKDEGRLMTLFMIVPMFRICGMFLNFDFFFRALTGSYLLVILILAYSIKLKINPGYTAKWLWMAAITAIIGLASGFILNSLINFNKDIRLIMILPVLVFAEEVYFRGMLQQEVEKQNGLIIGIVINGILYGIYSLSFGWQIALVFFGVGLVCGALYGLTKNVFVAMPIGLAVHVLLLAV